MKTLIVILCFAAQLFVSSAAQAWSLADSYRKAAGLSAQCQIMTAANEESQEENSDNESAEEEEPDCE